MEYYLALRMRRLSVRQTGRYAPVRPVAAVRSVPRSDKPNKKHYDPRVWLRRGEEAFKARLKQAFEELNDVDTLA